MSKLPSDIDGRYAVRAELGRGSMGRVVSVTDSHAGNAPFACKLLEDPTLRADFTAEVDLLRAISHPAFVTAHQLGIDRFTRQPYAILELCQGETLADVRLEGDELVQVSADILRALDHLHRLGLVHGDLAPANVMLLPGGISRVKVLDLGAGGRRGERDGTTSGVLAFASPERLSGEPLAPAGDLWSVGCLVFQLVHGRHPWPGYPKTSAGQGPIDRAGLSPHPVDPVLDRLLSPSPEDRYPTAAAALTELEALLDVALPLVPRLDARRRLDPPPFVDLDEHLARAELKLRSAADAQQPACLTIGGPRGSGRTRILRELAHRLAARGIPSVLARPLPGEPDRACLDRLLAALGSHGDAGGSAAATARAIIAAARRTRGATAILVDDVDGADPPTAEAITALSRMIAAAPDKTGTLLLVTAGSEGDVRLGPWAPDHIEAVLAACFPGRRIGPRVTAPLAAACRGNPGLLIDVGKTLVDASNLQIDATAVLLTDPSAAGTAVPPSREEAARRVIASLPRALAAEAQLFGYIHGPVPEVVAGSRAGELVAAGVATWVAEDRLAATSDAMARACRGLTTPAAAHPRLAARWESAGDTVRALWHRLSGPDGATHLDAAERALQDLPAGEAAPLVEALRKLDWPQTASAAFRGGQVLEAVHRAPDAIELFERAAALATTPLEAARALARIGRLQAHQSRHARAIEALREALARADGAFDPAERADCLATLARSAVMSGAIDEAAPHCEEALALAGADPRLQGRLRYTLGLIHWYRGATDSAAEAFEGALEHTRAAQDTTEEAAVVTGLGLVAHRRGDLEAALARYREALKLGEANSDDARVLTALQNLGVVFHERGDWIAALDAYREALALAETLDQTGRVVQLAGNLGNLWRYLGELDLAREVLQKGLEGARGEDNRHMEALILNLLADVASDDEQWVQAERLWRDAIAVTLRSGCGHEEAEARVNLARLLLERRDYRAARDEVTAARAVAEQLDQPTALCQCDAIAASVERQSVHGDVDAARVHLEAAMARLPDVTNPGARWPIQLEAMWFALARGDIDAAATSAREVRAALKTQLDSVPARHRAPFRRRRDRRAAWLETEALLGVATQAGPGAKDTGWSRLLEINKRLATEHNVNQLLEYIMDSAVLLTGAERGFLLLAQDDATEELDVRVARNLDQENIRKKHLKISYGIARRVIEAGDPVITVDAMEDERYRDQLSVHDLRLRSIVCLPMSLRGRVLGAIYLDNRFRASAFSETDLPFMRAFTDLAAIALDNARLLEAKERSQQALEKARAQVQSLNDKLAAQLEQRTKELADTHRVMIRQRRQLVDRHQYANIIGESDALRRVFAMMDRLLDNDVPVLIEGESGTGKELVARAIHFNGGRQDRPFVAVNCGAIPATLLESELFGHVRGAFTNATSDKKGLFEAAHTGTLLLDEIGELPLEMQVKLLRVLQNGDVKKVGANHEIRVDVRILAATNRRLEDEVRAGRFREDLYYRLSVVPIVIPPLRDRRDDIPLLVSHFLEQNRKNGLGAVTGIAKESLALLARYAWPGNIRQLEMVLKNASVFAEGAVLQPHDFESFPEILGVGPQPSGTTTLKGRTLAEIEREAIIVALRANRGNKKRSAEQLGIDRRTLYNKLAAYQIVVEKELRVS